MKTRSHHTPMSSSSSIESLESRNLMSTVGYGDFNHDGREDMAVLTNPTTVTVSLAKSGGGYTVSAILAIPKNRPASDIYVGDFNSDGKADINAVGGSNSGGWVTHHF